MEAVIIGSGTVELVQGDITIEALEAIGNAANTKLAGGGGVDGAIHRAGGPAIMADLKAKYPNGCPTGEAVLTSGGRLKATYVIHAVGPVYRGRREDAQRLASAYRCSLELCVRHGIRTVAFPSISTGIYGYPLDEAAPIALETVCEFLRGHPRMTLVRFVLFDRHTLTAYRDALPRAASPGSWQGKASARSGGRVLSQEGP